MGLKVSIGTQLLPVLTNLLKNQDDVARAHELAAKQGINLASASREVKGEYLKLAIAEREAQAALEGNTESLDENTISAEENAEAIKAISQAHQNMLGLIGKVASRDRQAISR
jgi:vacuolar-type H+-ATPase subunit B/Vma2